MRENAQWMEYRNKLENALNSDTPMLELTIQSSATLIKGEKIQINALGLVSHESKRAFPKIVESHDRPQGVEQDMRDGFVYFGCKKSIK